MQRIILVVLLICSSLSGKAQDILGQVDVVSNQIQGVDPKVFSSLKKSLNEFINNRKWTDDNFQPNERIECNFFINLTSKLPNNVYKGTLTIQAARPVFNSTYKTPTFNFIDKDFIFKYSESQSLDFSDQSVSGNEPLASNLTATFAYYLYFVVGLDYDSFSPNGGSSYFRKAQNIVNNAPESPKSIYGWKASEGDRNRYWLVNQILSPKFETFHTYWYNYHRNGLDVMAQNPEKGLKTIFDGLTILDKLNNENPASILLQVFFNTKSDELANLLKQENPQQRKTYVDQLVKLDVINAGKYRSAR